MVKEGDSHGMQPRVVIAERRHTYHLFKLVNTVRSHDSRIRVKQPGNTAKYNKYKADEWKLRKESLCFWAVFKLNAVKFAHQITYSFIKYTQKLKKLFFFSL